MEFQCFGFDENAWHWLFFFQPGTNNILFLAKPVPPSLHTVTCTCHACIFIVQNCKSNHTINYNFKHYLSKPKRRIIETGKDLGRLLAQRPTRSKVSTEFRPDCSELCLVGWKFLGKEMPQTASWITCSTADCPWDENVFPYDLSKSPLLQLMTIVSCLPARHLCKVWFYLLSHLLPSTGRLLLGSPKPSAPSSLFLHPCVV